MEIHESIYEGLVDSSYLKTTVYDKCYVYSRKMKGRAAPSKSNPEKGRYGKRKKVQWKKIINSYKRILVNDKISSR